MTLDMEIRFADRDEPVDFIWEYTAHNVSSILDAYYIALDNFRKTHKEDVIIWHIKCLRNAN